LNEADSCTVLLVQAFDTAHGLSVPQAWNWLGCRFEIRAGGARPQWVVRDFLCGLAGCGILERIDRERSIIMAAGAIRPSRSPPMRHSMAKRLCAGAKA
jgi:hypothetical protein